MIKLLFLCLVPCLFVLPLSALQIIDARGVSQDYSNEELHKHETQELKTSREKDGVIKLSNWLGFRFDVWLRQHNLGDFSSIRFESADRYLVSFTRAEFDSLESWLVIGQDEIPFSNNALRMIFPQRREMQWIRDLDRIVLEDFQPLPMPQRFYLMQPFLSKHKLHSEPAPFVNMEGWFFAEFLPALSPQDTLQVILFSRDNLKLSLRYPFHLGSAVLEKTSSGTCDLKSPQIPGGMWLKDIVYLQAGNTALIRQDAISSLIGIALVLAWDKSPDLYFHITYQDSEEILGFSDALAEPQIFTGALYFELH